MKQKRKHLLKKFLIFGIAFLLASCSEELFDEAIESSNKRAIKEVKFNELYKDSKFKNLIEKVSHTSNAARTSFENQNGFTISDGFVKVIETDSVISYTMLIERDVVTDTISFENLVIQENKFSASEKAYSIKYTPTIIAPSGHDSFYYEGTEVLKNLAFTGFNRADANAIETNNCYVNVIQVWCSQPNPGETNHHVARKGCLASTQYYKVVSILSSDCEGNDSSSSGSSGSNNNNAPQEPTGPGNNGGITSPVNPNQGFGNNQQIFPDTPCGRMQKKSSGSSFKKKFNDLNTFSNLNKKFETGYYEKADGSFNFMTGSNEKRTLKFEPGTTSFMHIHMNNYITIDADGNEVINYGVKMLSPGDIGSLIESASNSIIGGLSPYEAYGMMVSSEGIFSVNLTDINNVDLSPIMKAEMDFSYLQRASKIFKETSANSAERKEKLQKMLLELLKEKGLGDKIALFEGEVEQVPGQLPKINWTRKTIDSNGNLVETPC